MTKKNKTQIHIILVLEFRRFSPNPVKIPLNSTKQIAVVIKFYDLKCFHPKHQIRTKPLSLSIIDYSKQFLRICELQ